MLSASILGCWPFPPWKTVSEQDPEKNKKEARCFLVACCYWIYILFAVLRGKTGREWGRTEPRKLILSHAYPRKGHGFRVTSSFNNGGPRARSWTGQSLALNRGRVVLLLSRVQRAFACYHPVVAVLC